MESVEILRIRASGLDIGAKGNPHTFRKWIQSEESNGIFSDGGCTQSARAGANEHRTILRTLADPSGFWKAHQVKFTGEYLGTEDKGEGEQKSNALVITHVGRGFYAHLTNELRQSAVTRMTFIACCHYARRSAQYKSRWQKFLRQYNTRGCDTRMENYYDRLKGMNVALVLFLKDDEIPGLDRTGNGIAASYIREKVFLDVSLSWLSTLGGAFSALGDQSRRFSARATDVCLKQLKIAKRSGDPLLYSRCKLYCAIALMQRGSLSLAEEIIMDEFEFAMSLPEDQQDKRLIKMCQGILEKLNFHKVIHYIQKTRKCKFKTALALFKKMEGNETARIRKTVNCTTLEIEDRSECPVLDKQGDIKLPTMCEGVLGCSQVDEQ